MKTLARVLTAALLGGTLAGGHAAEGARDALAEGFARPPADARPLVFWQWVNGNVTQEGIRLDLEWMQRIGLAGALMFDIGFSRPPVPQYVVQRVGFGTGPWRKAVAFAAAEAKRLGLLLGAQSSGGWSVSGGPMVPPEQAMKKLVWSETLISPDTPPDLKLAPPPSVNGPYQDFPIDNAQYLEPRRSGDIAVLACRLPDLEQRPAPRAVLSGVPDASILDDGSYAQSTVLTPDAQGNAVIDARMEVPPLAVTIGKTGRGPLPPGAIESSDDGLRYVTFAELPGDAAQPSPVVTFSSGQRPAKFWRIRFTGLKSPLALTEVRFDAGARIHRAQEKAGFGTLTDYSDAAWSPAGSAIDPRQVIDLTSQMAADGTLSWRPGQGRWVVLRFGWSLTGRRTVPATGESVGLEVDKLDATAVRAFAESFHDLYAMGDASRLDISLTDSWEAGQQTWTPAMFEEFSRRRGYDLRPWLPVLTGRIVGDVARSERLLADFRRTISDLLVENHYGVLADAAHRRGMTYMAQAAGTDRPTVIDGLQAKGRVDVPTGEFWFYPEGSEPKPPHLADVREAASAAHIYGRRLVAVESLTSQGEEPWALGPAQWRRMMDRFFAEGANRVILHTSAHQPFTDRVPGMTLRQYGQHFTRNETWAEDAGAWVDYLARTSFLLQQGRPVADMAIYLGENAAAASDPPEGLRSGGFDYDYLNTEVLLNSMQARDGSVVLPDGVSYRMIVVAPHVRHLSLPVLRKLLALVREGATVVMAKPWGAAGLADDTNGFRALADQTWGGGKVGVAEVNIGLGRLYSTLDLALERERPLRDIGIQGPNDLHWSHRRTPDADIYFISNQSRLVFDGRVNFRVRGRDVEVWDAVDGARSRVPFEIGDQTTAVDLHLAPRSAIFVVFRGMPAASPKRAIVAESETLQVLQGPWDVQFLDGRGAPARVRLTGPWNEHTHSGIRYYSGRARYSRHIQVPADWLGTGRRIELDLGEVGDIARVQINGRDLGAWWSAPFRRDISDALRTGRNRLEITVTNYWVNRLIGDEQPGAHQYTFTPIRPYQAHSPLRRSGLLGPVRLLSKARNSP